jgi:AcrR family transcriptional regulator
MAAPATPSPGTLDGRVRRGERNRGQIVDALFELVGEGILEPTAQAVAERAGVGIRTVFRHFDDMESLFAEMDARLTAEARPLLAAGRPAGGIAERSRELVRRRVALFERVAPYKRSGNVKRWRSPFLRSRHADLVRQLRRDLVRWLPEIDRAPSELADALELATSFEAWDRLRTEQRLGRERAAAAMERTVAALVAGLGR